MSPQRALEPLVSVIMPAYNHERFVEEAIRSIWSQTYSNIELIVVNDGSQDSTLSIVLKLSGFSPVKMQVVDKPNGGIANALNVGISRATGEFIALLASDDFMMNHRIGRQVEEMLSKPDIGILHTSAYRVDEQGAFLHHMTGTYTPATGACLKEFMLGKAGVVSPTVMLRRSVIDIVGKFDEGLAVEDWPYFLRATSRGVKFGFINEELTCWRKTSGSAGNHTSKIWREAISEIKKYLHMFEEDDAKMMLDRMYRYEFESALLQTRYSNAVEILREARSQGCSFAMMAKTATWSITRNIAKTLLPETVYGALRSRLRRRKMISS